MSHLMKGTIATLLLLVPAIGLSEDLKQPASTVGRPYVGIIPDLAAQVKGMKVRDVIRNGPADRAGVRASDVITRVDTKEIQTFRDFLASTRFFRIGGKVTLVVKREDREMTITIVPVARPAKVEVPPVKRPPAKVAADGTVTFFNHGAEVRGIAIFPDGKRVLSASSREDRVWELATGKDLGQFTAARSLAVAISGDGKRVAIEGFDALTIHDTANNKQLLSINPHGEWDRRFPFRPTVEAMAYSADRSLLATAGSIAKVGGRHGLPGGIVKLWDAATGEEIRSFGDLPHRAGSVAFSHDGRYLAAGTFGASGELPDAALLIVWEVDSGKRVFQASMQDEVAQGGNPCNVRAVAYHPDGQHILTASLDRKVRVWDLTGKLVDTRTMLRRRSTGIAAFSSDARLVAFGGYRVVSIHDVSTGRETKSFPFDVQRIRALAFSNDGKWLVAGGGDSFQSGAAKAWKVVESR